MSEFWKSPRDEIKPSAFVTYDDPVIQPTPSVKLPSNLHPGVMKKGIPTAHYQQEEVAEVQKAIPKLEQHEITRIVKAWLSR